MNDIPPINVPPEKPTLNAADPRSHMVAAETELIQADAQMDPNNRNETCSAALHTAMFYLEIAKHSFTPTP